MRKILKNLRKCSFTYHWICAVLYEQKMFTKHYQENTKTLFKSRLIIILDTYVRGAISIRKLRILSLLLNLAWKIQFSSLTEVLTENKKLVWLHIDMDMPYGRGSEKYLKNVTVWRYAKKITIFRYLSFLKEKDFVHSSSVRKKLNLWS